MSNLDNQRKTQQKGTRSSSQQTEKAKQPTVNKTAPQAVQDDEDIIKNAASEITYASQPPTQPSKPKKVSYFQDSEDETTDTTTEQPTGEPKSLSQITDFYENGTDYTDVMEGDPVFDDSTIRRYLSSGEDHHEGEHGEEASQQEPVDTEPIKPPPPKNAVTGGSLAPPPSKKIVSQTPVGQAPLNQAKPSQPTSAQSIIPPPSLASSPQQKNQVGKQNKGDLNKADNRAATLNLLPIPKPSQVRAQEAAKRDASISGTVQEKAPTPQKEKSQVVDKNKQVENVKISSASSKTARQMKEESDNEDDNQKDGADHTKTHQAVRREELPSSEVKEGEKKQRKQKIIINRESDEEEPSKKKKKSIPKPQSDSGSDDETIKAKSKAIVKKESDDEKDIKNKLKKGSDGKVKEPTKKKNNIKEESDSEGGDNKKRRKPSSSKDSSFELFKSDNLSDKLKDFADGDFPDAFNEVYKKTLPLSTPNLANCHKNFNFNEEDAERGARVLVSKAATAAKKGATTIKLAKLTDLGIVYIKGHGLYNYYINGTGKKCILDPDAKSYASAVRSIMDMSNDLELDDVHRYGFVHKAGGDEEEYYPPLLNCYTLSDACYKRFKEGYDKMDIEKTPIKREDGKKTKKTKETSKKGETVSKSKKRNDKKEKVDVSEIYANLSENHRKLAEYYEQMSKGPKIEISAPVDNDAKKRKRETKNKKSKKTKVSESVNDMQDEKPSNAKKGKTSKKNDLLKPVPTEEENCGSSGDEMEDEEKVSVKKRPSPKKRKQKRKTIEKDEVPSTPKNQIPSLSDDLGAATPDSDEDEEEEEDSSSTGNSDSISSSDETIEHNPKK